MAQLRITTSFFPTAPLRIWDIFLLEDGRVRVHITAPGVTQLDTAGVEQPVAMLDFPNIQNADPPALHFRSLRFYPIERDGRYGVRLKDTQSPTRLHFPGISSFDVDPTWRIEGRFEPFAEPRSINVPSIIGTVSQTPWPGNVVFSAGGEQHRLAVFGEASDRQFFVVFADRSNGQETYGGGRFLVVDHHPDGRATIDFNKAYSPPCAFTPYATCPLPPAQNRLDLYVRAGEQQYSGDHCRTYTSRTSPSAPYESTRPPPERMGLLSKASSFSSTPGPGRSGTVRRPSSTGQCSRIAPSR